MPVSRIAMRAALFVVVLMLAPSAAASERIVPAPVESRQWNTGRDHREVELELRRKNEALALELEQLKAGLSAAQSENASLRTRLAEQESALRAPPISAPAQADAAEAKQNASASKRRAAVSARPAKEKSAAQKAGAMASSANGSERSSLTRSPARSTGSEPKTVNDGIEASEAREAKDAKAMPATPRISMEESLKKADAALRRQREAAKDPAAK